MSRKRELDVSDLGLVDIAPLAVELQRLRMEKRLSLDGLAERTGISRNTIHRYENHGLNPTAKALMRLAIGLEINISDLVKPLNHLPER
ncbi:Helix-turn-helix domain [Mycobacteroides abscessus subsp. massiliense]|nr:Helix-turn-helix domain [Mycobacteroides abscessus subsp. massiliense]SKG95293.1 Helix-turn-helix domain [Mycobacteroides abscessus subsp. massiliense]SKH77035.1 Helix-turn-helix domain [Mycobacteroides abscessus subsp. massiliense]SKI58624.1 Helix-turn-helix domain [Mycobacteroides abscessus subsp. massiliense]SKI71383.1 Helix-turn-helix domain [Mycobacteroides abscessus subsp. massiliense]